MWLLCRLWLVLLVLPLLLLRLPLLPLGQHMRVLLRSTFTHTKSRGPFRKTMSAAHGA